MALKVWVVLSDKYTFPAFEVLFLLFVVVAFLRDKKFFRSRGSELAVTRGEQSRQHFFIAYGLASVVLLQIINSAETLKGHKVIISVVDLVLLSYLTHFNGWFRNKIVGWANWWIQKPET